VAWALAAASVHTNAITLCVPPVAATSSESLRCSRRACRRHTNYYSRETTLEPVKDNADLVKIRHELSLTVIANQHNASAKFSARFLLDEFSDKNLEIEYFRVTGCRHSCVCGPRPERI
jgi:hypothetical protein